MSNEFAVHRGVKMVTAVRSLVNWVGDRYRYEVFSNAAQASVAYDSF